MYIVRVYITRMYIMGLYIVRVYITRVYIVRVCITRVYIVRVLLSGGGHSSFPDRIIAIPNFDQALDLLHFCH